MPVQLSDNPHSFACTRFFHSEYAQLLPRPLSDKGISEWVSQQHGFLLRDPGYGLLWYKKAESFVIESQQDVVIYGLNLNGSRCLEHAALALNKRLIEEERRSPGQLRGRG